MYMLSVSNLLLLFEVCKCFMSCKYIKALKYIVSNLLLLLFEVCKCFMSCKYIKALKYIFKQNAYAIYVTVRIATMCIIY